MQHAWRGYMHAAWVGGAYACCIGGGCICMRHGKRVHVHAVCLVWGLPGRRPLTEQLKHHHLGWIAGSTS